MATKTIPQLPSAAPLSGSELFESTQVSGGPIVSIKVTANQLRDYVLGFSGSENNMIFVGSNGILQDTNKMTFNDSGNGVFEIGGPQLTGNEITSALIGTTDGVSIYGYQATGPNYLGILRVQTSSASFSFSDSTLFTSSTLSMNKGQITMDNTQDGGTTQAQIGCFSAPLRVIAQTSGNSMKVDANGFTINDTQYVNEISNDSTSVSASALMTANAIQTAITNSKFTGTTVSASASAIDGQVVLVSASGGAITIELSYSENAYIVVKKIDASVNSVTIQADDGKTIDGAASKSLTVQYQSFTFFGSGGTWNII